MPNGNLLVVVGESAQLVELYTPTGKCVRKLGCLAFVHGEIRSVAVSIDCIAIVSSAGRSTSVLAVLDYRTGALLHRFGEKVGIRFPGPLHPVFGRGLMFAPDGSALIVFDNSKRAFLKISLSGGMITHLCTIAVSDPDENINEFSVCRLLPSGDILCGNSASHTLSVVSPRTGAVRSIFVGQGDGDMPTVTDLALCGSRPYALSSHTSTQIFVFK